MPVREDWYLGLACVSRSKKHYLGVCGGNTIEGDLCSGLRMVLPIHILYKWLSGHLCAGANKMCAYLLNVLLHPNFPILTA